MMLTVIINCGFMTLSKPPEFVEDILEHVFMTIYTLECIVKIIARGFFVDQLRAGAEIFKFEDCELSRRRFLFLIPR